MKKVFVVFGIGLLAAMVLLAITGLAAASAARRMAAVRTPQAGAPTVVSYQGQVAIDGVQFEGIGYFKFAVVDATGTISYWSNDGTSAGGGEPVAAISLSVSGGLFDVMLGDTGLAGMSEPLNADAFDADESYLRVWFSATDSDYQLLTPDRRIASVPYALHAQEALTATTALTAGDADTLDGQHASELGGIPTGALLLGASEDEPSLTAAGLSYTGRWFDTWNARTELPTPRHSLGAAVVNGMIHVIGGSDSGYKDAHEVYDPATDSWSDRAPLPTGREGMALVSVDGVIYAIGGSTAITTCETTVEAYYPISDTWFGKAPMPTGRYGVAAAAVDGIIYVMGGRNCAGDYMTTVEAYDPVANSWSPRMPLSTGRQAAAAAEVEGIIYVMGGMSASEGFETAHEAYNPITNLWTGKAELPKGRRAPAAAVVGGQIYLLGGFTSDSDYSLNTVYDPVTDSWSTRSDLPTGRYYLTAAAVDGQIYALGGGPLSIGETINEVYGPPLYLYQKD